MNDHRDEIEYHFTFPNNSGAREAATAAAAAAAALKGPAAAAAAATAAAVDESSSSSSSSSQGSNDDFVFVYDETKRPVVVLLGWAGCQDKYLAKYSAIYEERSCTTLRCTAPLEYLFWRRHRLPLISRRLLQLIAEKCPEERPVFFHIFSNGGAIFYQHISSVMQQTDWPLKVKGVIFDSSPGQRRLTSLYRAISAIIGGHPITNMPISLAITFFLSIFWLMEMLLNLMDKENVVLTDPIALVDEKYSWPQIFLYSNADTLVHASDVERFATKRAERGVPTQLVLFSDSPHVKHYATYRDVYVNTVCGFINECLNDQLFTTTTTTTTTSNRTSNEARNEQDEDYEPKDSLRLTKRIVYPEMAGGQ